MRDILIHVRDHSAPTRAVRFGAALAAALDAAVTGVHVVPGYYDAGLEPELVAMLAEVTAKQVEAATAAAAAFEEVVTALGVRKGRWRVAEGRLADALEQAAAGHDLLILEHAADSRYAVPDIPARALLSSAACLVLPRRECAFDATAPVAIGWNGSAEAHRAVHAALPLLPGRRVLLLHGEERPAFPALTWHPPFDLAQDLRARGIAVETREIDARGDAAGGALLDAARGFGAELLVMGAYGRSRFSEWILGGATRHVLAEADLPVLLRR